MPNHHPSPGIRRGFFVAAAGEAEMQTVKIADSSDGVRLEEAVSQVAILREGQTDWDVLTKACRENGSMPRVLLMFSAPDGSQCVRYLYDDDRAWIMNANGKTVATV